MPAMHGQRITLVKAKNNIFPNLPLPNRPVRLLDRWPNTQTNTCGWIVISKPSVINWGKPRCSSGSCTRRPVKLYTSSSSNSLSAPLRPILSRGLQIRARSASLTCPVNAFRTTSACICCAAVNCWFISHLLSSPGLQFWVERAASARSRGAGFDWCLRRSA